MLWSLLLVLVRTCLIESHHHHDHHFHHGYQNQESTTPPSSQGISYGPSIISLTKYNRDVHGPTIFHPDTGRTINLEDYPNYSVVVPLASGSPTATSNQVFVSRRLSGPGEFHVVAPPGHGVMAVIQSMDLRTAPSGCNDFIQFGDVDTGVETAGTCGKVDGRDGSFAPSLIQGPRIFQSRSGKIKILFYHGYIWGLVRDFNFDVLDPSRNPMLRLEITFTAYKECDDALNVATHSPSYYQYRSCTNVLGSKSCIPAQLFCDRVINCAFEEKFGSDEYIANCLPVLLKLLLPRVRQPLPTTWIPTTLSSVANPATFSTTTVPSIVTSVSTTASTTTTSTTTTAPSTTSITTTIATTTPPSTTTTTATTTATSTTTTPEPALQNGIELSSTTAPPTSVPFTTQLHNHLFDISSPIITATHRTTPPTPTPSTTTTLAPTLSSLQAVEFTSAEFHTVRLPPEFEETVNYPDHDISVESNSPNSTTLLSHQNPQLLEPNMTFTGIDSSTLSVEEDKGQVEQLNADIDVNEAESHDQNKDTLLINPGMFEEETNGSTTLWIIFVILVLLAVICILRLYCCRNRVIWIPNPKMLRVQRKRREMSINNPARNYPEVHRSSTLKKSSMGRSTETTPPSYDILFPKTRLHDADVLP